MTMPDLKLAKLPDRSPVRITITLSPELGKDLAAYASMYRAAYGTAEAVEELVPYMVRAFLDSDRSFVKARKSMVDEPVLLAPAGARRGRRPRAGRQSLSPSAAEN